MADNIAGSAKIEITAEVAEGSFQQAVDAALEKIKAQLEVELKINVGDLHAAGGAAPTNGKGKAKASEQGVDANVGAVTGLEKSVHAALQNANGSNGFQLPIDLGHLRAQVQGALTEPFKIKIRIDGQVEVPGVAGHPAQTTGGQGAISPETESLLHRALAGLDPSKPGNFGAAANALYNQLNETFKQHKSTTFGDLPEDDTQGRLRELIEHFGPLGEWATIAGPRGRNSTIGPSVMGALQARGLTEDQVKEGISSPLFGAVKQGSGNTAAGMTWAEITRRIAEEIAHPVNRAVEKVVGAAQTPATVIAATAPGVATVAAEAKAALTASRTAAGETPSPSVVAPETRGEAKTLLTQSLDEALGSIRQVVASFPKETGKHLKGSTAFDFDPETNSFLSSSEIKDRSGGQLPTPRGYSQLLRAAAVGAFSHRAEVVDERGKGTGEFVTYDPDMEDEETKKLSQGKVANISGGRQARGLKATDYAERLVRAADQGVRGKLVPAEDLTASEGGGEPIAVRVIKKLLGPQAATLSYAPQAVKTSEGEKGKRSGTLTSAGLSLEQGVALDQKYIKEYDALEYMQREGLEGGSMGSGQKRRIDQAIDRQRSRLADLEEQGADPASVRWNRLPPSEQASILRARRASQVEQNLENQARVKADADPDVTKPQALNWDIANVAIDKMVKFADAVRGGQLAVSRETLPEGYEVRDTQELNRSTFVRQHLASIMDEFRGQIGEPTTGRLEVPNEFKSTFAPVISSVFRELASEPGPGNPALRSSTSPATRRALSSVSFAESDRVLAEAAEFRQRKIEHPMTGLDERLATMSGRIEGGGSGSTTQGRLAEIETRRALLKAEEAARIAAKRGITFDRQGKSDEIDQIAGSGPLPRDSAVRAARADFRRSFSQSKAGQEFQALGDESDILKDQLAQAKSEFHEIKSGARELILSASGQAQLFGPGLETHRTPPTLTGEETASAISSLEPLDINKTLGRSGSEIGVALAAQREALEQISQGVAPGLTRADFDRRAASERGLAGSPEGGGLSGDRTREVTSRTAFVAGTEEAPLPAIAGGGRGKPPTLTGLASSGPDGEKGKFDFGHGQVHVIVDNVPLRVAWEGAAASSGGNGRYASTSPVKAAGGASGGDGKPPETEEDGSATGRPKGRRRKNITTRDIGTAADLGRVYTFDPEAYEEQDRLTEVKSSREREVAAAAHTQGRTRAAEAAIAAAARRDTASERLAAKIGQENSGSDIGTRNVRRQQLGLNPLLSDVTGDEAQAADDERARLAGVSNRANRRILRRGFTASVTDLLQAPAFEKQVQAVNAFNRETSQLGGLLDQLAKANSTVRASEEELGAARAKGLKNIDGYTLALERENKNRALVQQQVDNQRQRVAVAQDKLPGVGAAAGNLLVGGLAAAGAFGLGSVVFQLAGQALQLVEHGLAEVVGPEVEKAFGFRGIESAVGRELGAAARQGPDQGGQIAAATAATGLTANALQQIGPALTKIAEAEAGNAAFSEQLRLQRAGFAATQAEANAAAGQPSGLLQPAGGIPGITRSTGGFLGSPLGATPSLFEQLGGAGGVGPAGQTLNNLATGFDATIGKSINPLLVAAGGLPLGKTVQHLFGLDHAEVSPQGLSGALGDVVRAKDPVSRALATNELQNTAKLLSDFHSGITDVTESLKKADSEFKVLDVSQKGWTKAVQEASDAALRAAGVDEQTVQLFRDNAIAFAGPGNRALTGREDIKQLGEDALRGASLIDPEQLIRSTERQRQAQVFAEDQRRGLQLGTVIPSQFGINQAINPVGNLTAPLEASGVKGLGGISALLGQINTDATAGRKQAIDFVTNGAVINGQQAGGLGAEAGEQFAAALAKAADYGQQISDLQIGIQTEHAAYAAEQYSVQIYQATRSLRDARGLTGEITGNNKDNLGVLERQQFLLQRQAQSLQLGLSQKQINFSVATAGFTAPGDTPEERSARIQQAKIEAEYAQKQLNIQKELFRLGGQSFRITASRQVRDLVNQLGLLERGREVQLHTEKSEAKIKALTILQSKENQKVEAFFNAAVQRTGDVIDLEAQLIASTAAGLAKVTNLAINAFTQTYQGIIAALSAGVGAERPNSIGPDARLGRASGAFFMTDGPTSLGPYGVAGEAGGEAIAVISAPKKFNPSSLGGGQTTIINVTGNTLLSEKDMNALVYRFERALNQKGALLGYNRPF